MSDVGDENSPYAKTGMSNNFKLAGKGEERRIQGVASSPLAERARGGNSSGNPSSGRGTSSKRNIRQEKSSRRQTAEAFSVTDVLQNLASPAVSSTSHTGQHVYRNSSSGSDEGASLRPSTGETSGHQPDGPVGGGGRGRYKRRQTARLSSIRDITASPAACSSDYGGSEGTSGTSSLQGLGLGRTTGDLDDEEDERDDTADFSSLMALVTRDSNAGRKGGHAAAPAGAASQTQNSDAGDGDGARGNFDSTDGGNGNSRGSSWLGKGAAIRPRAPRLSNQISGNEIGARGGGSAAAEFSAGQIPRPERHKDRSSPQRPRPIYSLEGYGMPTAKSNAKSMGDDSDDGSSSTGANVAITRRTSDGRVSGPFAAAVSDIGDVEMDDDEEREYITTDIGSMIAELEGATAAADAAGGRADEGGADFGGGGDPATRGRARLQRRQTAEKISTESLLRELDEGDEGVHESTGEHSQAAAASNVGTPKSAAGKRKKKRRNSSRRLTADFSELNMLLGDDNKDDVDFEEQSGGQKPGDTKTASSMAGSSILSGGQSGSGGGWAAKSEASAATPTSGSDGVGSGAATADHATVVGMLKESASATPSPHASAAAVATVTAADADGNSVHLASGGSRASTADGGALTNLLDSSFYSSSGTSSLANTAAAGAGANTPNTPTHAGAGSRSGGSSSSVGVSQGTSGNSTGTRTTDGGGSMLVLTPGSRRADSIVGSSPSSAGGGIEQCLADASALREEQRLAPRRSDVVGAAAGAGGGGVRRASGVGTMLGGKGVGVEHDGNEEGVKNGGEVRPSNPGRLERRLTCDRGNLFWVMDDLESPSTFGQRSISTAGSSPLNTRSVAEGSVAGYSPATSRRSRDEEGVMSIDEDDEDKYVDGEEESAYPAALAAADAAAANAAVGTGSQTRITNSGGRRLTATLSSYHSLLDDIGSEDNGEEDDGEGTDGGDSVASGGSDDASGDGDGDGDGDNGIDGDAASNSYESRSVDGLELTESLQRASTRAVADPEGVLQSENVDVSTSSTSSPEPKMLSPPVACRTRSKSPSPAPKKKQSSRDRSSSGAASGKSRVSTKPGDGEMLSPVSGKKRASAVLSPSVKAWASTKPPPPPPSSATRNGHPQQPQPQPLKSCLSSKKRARTSNAGPLFSSSGAPSSSSSSMSSSSGAASSGYPASGSVASSANGGRSAAGGGGDVCGAPPPATPDGLGRRAPASPPMRFDARAGLASPSVGLDGIVGVGDVSLGVVETPRRVMFGDPMAAEFNHGSPSNRLTPMPSRDARSLFPLEKQREEETDDDEDTMANSAQLAEWDNVNPSQGMDDFDDFGEFSTSPGTNRGAAAGQDGVAVGGEQVDESGHKGEDIVTAISSTTPSPARRRRRQSEGGIKSPLGRSITMYSKNVAKDASATATDAPATTDSPPPAAEAPCFSPASEFDTDCEEHTANHLNASINGAGVPRSGIGFAASAAAATADNPDRSFSINSRAVHDISDSDSSMSLTGTFSSPAGLRSPDVSETLGRKESEVASTAVAVQHQQEEEEEEGEVDQQNQQQEEQDDRAEPDESVELAYTLNGSSLRESASTPGAGRLSTGSFMDIMSEVSEFEEEVMSEAQAEVPAKKPVGDQGNDDKHGTVSPTDHVDGDLWSPLRPTSKSSVAEAKEEVEEDGGDDDHTVELRDMSELEGMDEPEPAWKSVLAQVQDDISDGFRLATVTEETEGYPDETSTDIAAESGVASTATGKSNRDSTATVALPMDFSDLVKEDDLEHLSDKSRGDGGRRSSSNTGRRSSRSKKIKRESDVSSIASVDMDVDETEDIPVVRASSARRRSSASSGGIVSAAASRSAGGPLIKRAPSLPLSLPLPPRAPGGGAGSRRRASVSGGIGRVRETITADGDQAESHGEDASADSAADSAAGSSIAVTAADDSSGDNTSAAAPLTDPSDLVNSDKLDHDDDGDSGGDHRHGSISGSSSESKREREALPSGSVHVDGDNPEDIPPTHAPSARRRSSTSSGTVASAVASSSVGGNSAHKMPSLPLPLPPRAPAGGAGSRRRASVSTGVVGIAGDTTGGGERFALEAMISARRRASFAARPSAMVVGGLEWRGGSHRKRASEDGASPSSTTGGVRNLRRRLSGSSPGDDVVSSPAGRTEAAAQQPVGLDAGGVTAVERRDNDDDDGAGAMDAVLGSEETPSTGGVVKEKAATAAQEEDEEDVTDMSAAPILGMTIQELIAFVAPDLTTPEGQTIDTSVVSIGDGEDMAEMPDDCVDGMATTLDAAAAEMESAISVAIEEAFVVQQTVWQHARACPVLGEIDNAISRGDTSNEGMAAQARDMAARIKSQRVKEWGAWEVNLLERIAADAAEVLAEGSRRLKGVTSSETLVMGVDSTIVRAEKSIVKAEAHAQIRQRMEEGDKTVEAVKAQANALEEEAAELARQEQEAIERVAALQEARARREERKKAAAARAASVAHLLEVEEESIRAELDAWDCKEMVDVHLGLRLWCRPVRLHMDGVVLAFAAPHSPPLRHELTFVLTDAPVVRAKLVATYADRSASVSNPAVPAVGDADSASYKLSQLMFEGDHGLFSTGTGTDAGAGVGAVVSGLETVERVAHIRKAAQRTEWYVGRAYMLLQEIHELEKRYACTVYKCDYGSDATPGAALCVELVDWRSHRKVKLRFRVAPSHACFVGEPEVEVDIGSVDASKVKNAMVEVRGGRDWGLLVLGKAVQAASAVISSSEKSALTTAV